MVRRYTHRDDRWLRRERVNAALSALSVGVLRTRKGWSASAFVPIAVFVVAIVTYRYAYTTLRIDGPVHSDGEGYYAYLPSYLVYFNPSFKTFIATHLLPKYAGLGHLGPGQFGFSMQANGYWLNKYGIGVSVLLLPFFLAGHGLAIAANKNANGFSGPEMLAVGVASVIYMTAGLFVIRALLRRWFADWVVVVALLAITFGAGLFASTIWDPTFSHTYSFFVIALTLLLTVRWYERPYSWWRIIALGAACGLILDLRLTNGILLIAVPLWGVGSARQARERVALLWTHRWQAISGAASAVIVFFPQTLVWHIATGHWLVRTYPGEPFDFLHPHLIGSLLSFKPHGLLPYFPVLIFALAGLVVAWARRRDIAIPVTVALLLFWYLVSSWWDWSFTAGFGDRAFVDVLALLAIPLAMFFSSLRPRALRVACAGLAVALTLATCVLMVAYWNARLAGDGATITQYFSILDHPGS